MSIFEIWYLISQYLIFLTGIIYAGVAYFQLRAIHRQADITEKGISVLERAWISVGLEPNYTPRPEPHEIPFVVANHGRTPAQIKEINGKITISDSLIEYEIAPLPEGPLPTILTTFASQSQRHHIGTPRMDSGAISEVNRKTKLMMIYGWIIYDDIFGKRHVTRFLQVYSPRISNFIFPRDAKPQYNEAT
jgi:hypothetical protein